MQGSLYGKLEGICQKAGSSSRFSKLQALFSQETLTHTVKSSQFINDRNIGREITILDLCASFYDPLEHIAQSRGMRSHNL